MLTKSGTNRFDGSLFEYHRNDALDAQELLRHRRQARLPPQPVRRHASAGRSGANRAFFFVGYEALDRAARPDDLDRRAGRQRAARASCRPARSASTPPWRRSSPSSRAPTGRSLGQGLARLQLSRSRRRSISTSCRAASTTTPARTASSSRATRSTTPTSSCRPTTRSSRASSSRATSSSPASTAQVLSSRTLNTTRIGFSRTRIGQNVEANTVAAARRVRARPRHDRRHRHRRAEALRAAELGQPAAGAERVQRCRTISCTRAAGT